MNYEKEIQKLRTEIDAIDSQLISVLATRLKVVEQIGRLKVKNNVAPLDTKRWQKVKTKISLKAGKFGVPEKLVQDIYELIHKVAITIEEKV